MKHCENKLADDSVNPDFAVTEVPSFENLVQEIFPDLHRRAKILMSRERKSHTLSSTGLVNEAYLRLCSQRNLRNADKGLIIRACVTAMQRVLIDHARRKRRRGVVFSLDTSISGIENNAIDVIDLFDALESLSNLDADAAVVARLHIIGGMKFSEIAAINDVAERTVYSNWSYAKSWLLVRLEVPVNR